MYPNGGPSSPAPYQPPAQRSRAVVIAGWVLLVLAALVALGSLVGGDGFAGRIAGLLLAATLAVLGVMLVRPFASWKVAGPGAALALVLSMLIMPSTPKEPTPASGLVGPTSAAAVTSSATATVTVTATTTTTSSSPAPSTTTAAPTTTTTTTAALPNPGVTETDTRTPVPAPPRTVTTEPTNDSPSAYYKNCDAAKAAGAAPMRRGEPGYRPGLDRDGDGIACDR
ncbi:excalibur calcium-binding domain-containing protein [Tsukamurella sp. NPDC003166]|uniref:excalibur calcium-binding domain-containing protein n=1 Tax=Tsukamurella sp. NPDC003166 TaxID=3154444 RepID=UPI0033B4DB97